MGETHDVAFTKGVGKANVVAPSTQVEQFSCPTKKAYPTDKPSSSRALLVLLS